MSYASGVRPRISPHFIDLYHFCLINGPIQLGANTIDRYVSCTKLAIFRHLFANRLSLQKCTDNNFARHMPRPILGALRELIPGCLEP